MKGNISRELVPVVIFGSRGFTDYEKFCKIVYEFLEDRGLSKEGIIIVDGGARGVDTLAHRYAINNTIENERYFAEWDKYGKGAGHIRNTTMAKRCSEGYSLGIWDGSSRGTKSMMSKCYKTTKHLTVYNYIENKTYK